MVCCPCLLPLHGMLLFLTKPALWKHLLCPLVVVTGATVAALHLIQKYALAPQEEFFLQKLEGLEESYNHSTLWTTPQAVTGNWKSTTHNAITGLTPLILVPLEAGILSSVVFQMLFAKVTAKIISYILEERGVYQKIKERHHIDELPAVDAGFGVPFTVLSIAVTIVTIPLNLILVIGQVLYVLANGWLATWGLMLDLLPLIGYRKLGNQFQYVLRHPCSFVCFGAVVVAFRVIPFAGIIFAGGVAVAAALLFEGFVNEGVDGPDGIPVGTCAANTSNTSARKPLLSDLEAPSSLMLDASSLPGIKTELDKVIKEDPYVNNDNHFLHDYVMECQKGVLEREPNMAQNALESLIMELDMEKKKIATAFNRFDSSRDDVLRGDEIKFMMNYLGYKSEQKDVQMLLKEVDKNSDKQISLDEFFAWVAKLGGSAKLFESRIHAGEGKSALNAENLRFRLLECGIEPDVQMYWRLVAPETELDAAACLEPCQRDAIRKIRCLAQANHERALPALQQRCQKLGYGDNDLWMALAWIRELAPIIVHVNLGNAAEYLRTDSHYRNQFETKSSGGLLDIGKRTQWEQKLFSHAYNGAKPFDRPKYGVLNIWNDYRGVLGCKQYGDSYIVLKDVRLRSTFAPEDSANLPAKRLSVPDFYGHVLQEFSEPELLETLRVATGNVKGVIGDSESVIATWGKYKEAQIHGEIDLNKHVERIVVHERHRKESSKMEALAKAHGWKLTWMEDFKKELESKASSEVEEWRNNHAGIHRKDTSNLTDINAWTFLVDASKFDKIKFDKCQVAAGIQHFAMKGMEHPVATKASKLASKHAPALIAFSGSIAGSIAGEISSRFGK